MYHAALTAAPEARAAFLSDACEGDTALRREVESLLAQVAGSGLLDRSLAHGMIPHTTCLPGTRIGPFQVEALLGAGGMGEVSRARDTRLGREVAIKILAPVFTRDPERLSRFEREARLLGVTQSSEHRHSSRYRGKRRNARASDGTCRGRDAPGAAGATAQPR